LTKKLIREGKDVVNFAGGEPDFDTPLFIKKKPNLQLIRGLLNILLLQDELELKTSNSY